MDEHMDELPKPNSESDLHISSLESLQPKTSRIEPKQRNKIIQTIVILLGGVILNVIYWLLHDHTLGRFFQFLHLPYQLLYALLFIISSFITGYYAQKYRIKNYDDTLDNDGNFIVDLPMLIQFLSGIYFNVIYNIYGSYEYTKYLGKNHPELRVLPDYWLKKFMIILFFIAIGAGVVIVYNYGAIFALKRFRRNPNNILTK